MSKNTSYNIGLNTSLAATHANEKNRKLSNDTLNRRYIIAKLNEFEEQGLTEEQALDEIMKDDIIKEFEYLTKNGIDIRTTIIQWKIRNKHSKTMVDRAIER